LALAKKIYQDDLIIRPNNGNILVVLNTAT